MPSRLHRLCSSCSKWLSRLSSRLSKSLSRLKWPWRKRTSRSLFSPGSPRQDYLDQLVMHPMFQDHLLALDRRLEHLVRSLLSKNETTEIIKSVGAMQELLRHRDTLTSKYDQRRK